MSDKYVPYELYLDILKRREKGDFSMVDYDHNQPCIYDIQSCLKV